MPGQRPQRAAACKDRALKCSRAGQGQGGLGIVMLWGLICLMLLPQLNPRCLQLKPVCSMQPCGLLWKLCNAHSPAWGTLCTQGSCPWIVVYKGTGGRGRAPSPAPHGRPPPGAAAAAGLEPAAPRSSEGRGGGERPASGGRDHGAGFLQWERGAGREAALIGRRGCQSLGQAGSRLSAAPRRGRLWRWTWGCGAGR